MSRTIGPEVIPAALAGERLDRIVALVADITRSAAASLVEVGGAIVDGQVERSGKVRLREGQSVSVDLALLPTREPPAADPGVVVEVVHRDDDVVVVSKQAGLVVHPAPGHESGTLVNGLLHLFPEIAGVGETMRPGIVHRLDVGTSGLLVVARTQLAYETLVDALSEHEVNRVYDALVWGHLDAGSTIVDAPIGRDPRDPTRMAVVREGKWARTKVEEVERFTEPAELSLLRCTLETGRTHQIRVHLAAIDHPVVGDATYGGARSGLVVRRPMLHARRLEFEHPASGERLSFECEPPADMVAVIAACS